jgi:general nucleoside transport system permease protein
MRLEIRRMPRVWTTGLAAILSVSLALLVSGLLVWLVAGVSLSNFYYQLFIGALGSSLSLADTLTRATPLIFTGLSVAVAFRARLYNIGAEGQLYAGALAATWVGSGAIVLPPSLMLPLLLAAGAAGGALLMLLSAFLKLRFKVDEVVSTLLLNFSIVPVVSYLIFGPWRDPMSVGWPRALPIISEGILPRLIEGSSLSVGFLIAIGCALLIWALQRFTTFGYATRAVGANARGAAFIGISVTQVTVWTALVSGALAGLGGVTEISGNRGYLSTDLSPGYGYTGIAVAMLAGLNPLSIVPAALFVAIIYIGADTLSHAANVSSYLADMVTAIALLTTLGTTLLINFRIRLG